MVPLRLTGRASQWFMSQTEQVQLQFQTDWTHLKLAIANYFMNRHWLNKMKEKAIHMKYRQKDHDQETPTDYFIRKLEVLHLVHDLTDPETIMEVMNGAPREWLPFVDTSRMTTVQDLQSTLKYHEETLIHIADHDIERRLRALEHSSNKPYDLKIKEPSDGINSSGPLEDPTKQLVGAHESFMQPQFPKRDNIVSKEKTPEERGARPC